jgi:diguanylate cyclase (GGDEF)-like protein
MSDLLNDDDIDIFSTPALINNYELLINCGIISYIESLTKQLNNYKQIVSSAIYLFNGTTLDDILSFTVKQLSDHFLPDFIYFFFKPFKNEKGIFIRGYSNYKSIDEPAEFKIWTLDPFEAFFLKNPDAIEFKEINTDDLLGSALCEFEKLHPQIIAPIVGNTSFYGFMLIGPKFLKNVYTPMDISFIQYFTAFVSQAIQNNLNYEGALKDTKTGLFNHTFFMARLNQELKHGRRSNEPSSVIMLDIDHFKIFNDTYGHLAGDYALERIADTIKQSIRGQDIAARFGGEEFIILLPNTGRQMALTVAERLRNAVSTVELVWKPTLPPITVSVGGFTVKGNIDIAPKEVIDKADKALYFSKKNGRDRTTWYGTGLLNRISQLVEEKKIRIEQFEIRRKNDWDYRRDGR